MALPIGPDVGENAFADEAGSSYGGLGGMPAGLITSMGASALGANDNVSTGAGAAAALYTGGNPYLIAAMLALKYGPKLMNMGDKNMFLTEGNRLQDLAKKGVNIPQQLGATLPQGKGRSTDELAAIEEKKKAAGMYSNTEFAKTRDISLLKPEDIWGYSAFFEKYGNDWLNKFTPEQRWTIAQNALKSGAVNEHHGTIDIDWTKIKDPLAKVDTATMYKPPPGSPAAQAQAGGSSQVAQSDAVKQAAAQQKSYLQRVAAEGKQSRQDAARQQVSERRSNLLNGLLAGQQPIQYPTRATKQGASTGYGIGSALNKIIGG